MASRLTVTRYGRDALDALREVVGEAKRTDSMAPVTILVPNHLAGTVVRRHLAAGLHGRGAGIAGLYVTTLARLAEQLAAPRLAPRRPATRAVVAAAWRSALDVEPGVFAEVAAHPATVRALTAAHHQLRDLSDDGLDALAPTTSITPHLVRLHRAVVDRLSGDWYDSTDLLHEAVRTVTDDPVRTRELGDLVLYAPQDLTRAETGFTSALATHADLTVVAALTGVARADGAVLHSLEGLGLPLDEVRKPTIATATEVLNASDSDDEVRCVVRDLVATLRSVPAHRIAVLYAGSSPYARLLHEQLATAGITANGPGTRPVAERGIARVLTEVLALVDSDLARGDLFRSLANAPTRDFSGQRIPLSRWERVSRSAGVVSGDDWQNRLGDLIHTEQTTIADLRDDDDSQPWLIERAETTVTTATELRAFVTELGDRLAFADKLATWSELADWSLTLFHDLVGGSEELAKLPGEEQYAASTVELTLRSLPTLDAFGQSASLQGLRDVLSLELEAALPRTGSFGEGVLVAPMSAAVGLDVDVAYVVGLAEDLYPGKLHDDALLPEASRIATSGELVSHREHLHARHRHLLAALSAAPRVLASFPRGDLRRSSHRLPSRFLLPTLRGLAHNTLLPATEWQDADYHGAMTTSRSFAGSLASTAQPSTEQEWRVRRTVADGSLTDPVVVAAATMLRERASDAFTRFDGNLAGAEGLPDHRTDDSAISPTALESYVSCPHGYFVQRLLGVSPLEQPEDVVEISAADIGTLIHESLDALITEHADALPSYGSPWTPEQRQRLAAIGDQKAREFERRGLTGHPRLWERERVRILDDLTRLLDADDAWRASVDARVIASEMPFGLKGEPPVEVAIPGGRILMRGSADKVDLTRDGTLYVTDVKTGSRSAFKGLGADNPTASGTKLQLPVYAHAARERFGEPRTPVRALYWFVRKEPGRVEVPLTEEVERAYAETVGVIVSSIAAGLFPARAPEKPDFSWIQCTYCNPDGISHAAERERWERKRSDPLLETYVRLAEPDALDAVLDSALDSADAGSKDS